MRIDERKATQCKAQPAKVLVKEPFKVHKLENTCHLTTINEFSLTTAKRANERKQFEQFLKERELEKEMIKIKVILKFFFAPMKVFQTIIYFHIFKREQEQQLKEAEEVARLREETVFVAKPVRQYRSLEIKKAEAELTTVPKTPKFMKK